MADPMDQAVADVSKQLGLKGVTADQTRFIQEELAADKARQAPGMPPMQVPWHAFNGAMFMDFGASEFHAALTAAEQFAANTDWRFFPTQDLIQDAMAKNVNFSDPKAFEQYVINSGMMSPEIQAKYPWLGSGLGKSSYDSTMQNYKATWERLTGSVADEGDPNWQSHINDLIRQGVGTAQFEQQVRSDPGTVSRFGWLKHGQDYTAFQQYKQDPNNRQLAVARYGVDAANSDQSYLGLLDTATIASKGGSAITPQSQRQTANLAGQSSVR